MVDQVSLLQWIAQSDRLLWGEFYPEPALLTRAEMLGTSEAAAVWGIDMLTLPPLCKKIDQEKSHVDLFGRYQNQVQKLAELMDKEFPVCDDYFLTDWDAAKKHHIKTSLLLEGPIQMLSNVMPFEAFLIACMKEQRLMKDIMERYAAYLLQVVELAKQQGALAVVLGDDVAGQAGLMYSPRWLDVMYFPWLEDFVRQTKMQVVVHSDGDIRSLVDRYRSVGVVGVQSVERAASMRVEELVEKYPDFLFWGGIDSVCFQGEMDLLREEISRLKKLKKQGALLMAGSSTGLLDGGMEPAAFIEMGKCLRA